MTWSPRSIAGSLLSRYDAARSARKAPWGWRLSVGGLAIAVAGNQFPWALPVLSLVGLLFAWQCLHRYASTYIVPQGSRWQTGTSFGAGLLAASAYLSATFTTFEWRLRTGGVGPAAIILIAMGLGIWLTFGVLRHWWEAGYAFVSAGVVAAVGGLSLWTATTTPLPAEAALSWKAAFIRVAAVFVSIGLIEMTCRVRFWKKLRSFLSGPQVFETIGFAAVLAALVPFTESNRNLFDLRGVLILAIAAALIAICLVRVRWRLRQDWLWIRSVWKNAAEAPAAPVGQFAGFAITPALLLAPLAGWALWSGVFGLCVLATILKRIAVGSDTCNCEPPCRVRRSVARQRTLVAA